MLNTGITYNTYYIDKIHYNQSLSSSLSRRLSTLRPLSVCSFHFLSFTFHRTATDVDFGPSPAAPTVPFPFGHDGRPDDAETDTPFCKRGPRLPFALELACACVFPSLPRGPPPTPLPTPLPLPFGTVTHV